ncbi:MAG: ribosome maturation factor RimM [Solirubrobacteraceae bacterium]
MAASGSANEIAAAPGVAGRGWVELGRVLRPFGLDGGLLVALHSDDPANLLGSSSVSLRGAPGTIPFQVENAASVGPAAGGRARVRLWLAGVDSRERALVWGDATVLVPPDAIRELPAGEFYWRDLIGLTARSADGAELGRVAEILSTKANDVLVLRANGRPDLLLPVVDGLIVRLERELGELWLDPSAELLAEAQR